MGSPSRAGANGTIRTVPATSATINQWAGGFAGVLEQVCGLGVDFKGFGVIEQFQVEQLRHPGIVLQTDAKEYGNLPSDPTFRVWGLVEWLRRATESSRLSANGLSQPSKTLFSLVELRGLEPLTPCQERAQPLNRQFRPIFAQ